MSAVVWSDYKPGVKIHKLSGIGGCGIYLVRIDPGASIPWESHPQRESIQLLDGSEIRVTVFAPSSAAHGSTSIYPGDAFTIPENAEHKIDLVEPLLPALLLVTARPDFGSGA